MNKKVYFYIIGLLVLGIILLFVFMQTPQNPDTQPDGSDFGIYDSVDLSVNDFLSQSTPENQSQNLYDAIDASVEQTLNQ